MKKYIMDFIRRGLIAAGFGPTVLAVIYLIIKKQAGIETLMVDEVCIGIFSLTALAFVAGGMNIIYQMERLPLAVAILIQGVVLYVGYLATYRINGWLEQGMTPILVFTVIFILGYLAVWGIIFFVSRRNTARVNEILKKKQEDN